LSNSFPIQWKRSKLQDLEATTALAMMRHSTTYQFETDEEHQASPMRTYLEGT
ncbi:hypothetical protein PHMEG_00033745, partial [Phytophthora megakarya]